MRWWRPNRTPTRPAVDADRVRAALLGGALADAMAFAHEGRAPGPVAELRVGRISDDTQLTLATCEAVIASRGEVDPKQVGEHFVRWHRERGFVGVGAATAKALRELSVGGHWALVGRRGEMAAGNGAAIRVAPLAFVLDLSTRRGRQQLRDVSRITHHSDEAYVGALALALTLQQACRGWEGRRVLFASLQKELPDTRVRDRLAELSAFGGTIEEAAAAFGNGGYVVEAVPLALHAFCEGAESGDFMRMLRALVRSGGDCDSIGSMAGQCFGALHGTAALPTEALLALDPLVAETVERFTRVL